MLRHFDINVGSKQYYRRSKNTVINNTHYFYLFDVVVTLQSTGTQTVMLSLSNSLASQKGPYWLSYGENIANKMLN